MPISWIINLVALFLMVAGGQKMWTAVTNLDPEQATCQQFLARSSGAAWLDLSECSINYLESVKTYKNGKLGGERSVQYYTPVRAAGQDTGVVNLVVKAPPEVASILDPLFDDALDEAAIDRIIQENFDALVRPSTGVRGVVARGIDSDSDIKELLENDPPDSWQLTADWRIVAADAAPSLGEGALMFGIALLVLAWRTRQLLTRPGDDMEEVQEVAPERIGDVSEPK